MLCVLRVFAACVCACGWGRRVCRRFLNPVPHPLARALTTPSPHALRPPLVAQQMSAEGAAEQRSRWAAAPPAVLARQPPWMGDLDAYSHQGGSSSLAATPWELRPPGVPAPLPPPPPQQQHHEQQQQQPGDAAAAPPEAAAPPCCAPAPPASARDALCAPPCCSA